MTSRSQPATIRYDYANADQAALDADPRHYLNKYVELCRKAAKQLISLSYNVQALQDYIAEYQRRSSEYNVAYTAREAQLSAAQAEENYLRQAIIAKSAKAAQLGIQLQVQVELQSKLLNERNTLTSELNSLALLTEQIAAADAIADAKAARYAQLNKNDQVIAGLACEIAACAGVLDKLQSSVLQ